MNAGSDNMCGFTPGGGELLGIFSGGVPPAAPNQDPISDEKMPYPTPFSDLALKIQDDIFYLFLFLSH